MLQSVEILPGARRALRRAVHVECDVVSRWWDEPVPHLATDLSPQGIWLESALPLELGDEVVLAFRPPRWPKGCEVMVFGAVRRVDLRRRASDPRRAGMGIEFLDLAVGDEGELTASLRGLPPPLPRRRRARSRREQIWVDMLLTWEEDLGDRVNTFEVSERIGMVADCDFEPESLSELVTGSRPPHRWGSAA